MKKNLMIQVLTHSLAIIIGLGIGYFIWNPAPKLKTSKSIVKPKKDVLTAKGSTSDELTTKGISKDSIQKEILPLEENLEEPNSTSPTAINDKAICGGNQINLQNHLSSFAASIERDSIYYRSEDLSDCSGMFLRVMNSLNGICPNYVFPNVQEHRDTRRLGKWFYDHKNLQMVEDVTKYSHLIKPGAVIFYGQSDSVYQNLTIDKLVAEDGIEHVGVVTEVKKENNEVVQYDLFHGRTFKKIAKRTKYHIKEGKMRNGKYYPPYGNGRQHVIAIGFVTTPKEAS